MKSKVHSDWIDILRGLSAFGVVLFHVRVDLWVGWQAIKQHPEQFSVFDRACAWLSLATPFMGSTVMLFFLISGFCVHLPYASNARPLELGSYSKRRFWRIYPPYAMAVLLSLAVEYLLHAIYGNSSSSLFTKTASIFMLQNYGPYSGQLSTNPSLWSLPVEMELYIAYPIFFWILTRYGMKQSLAVVGLVSALMLFIALIPNTSHIFNPIYNFALYWIIWCAGAALAERFKSRTLPQWQWWHFGITAFLGVFVIALELFKIPEALLKWGWGAFYGMILFWALTLPNSSDLATSQRLSQRIKRGFVQIGVFSYSLYLIHFPLFMLAGSVWKHHFGSKPTNFLVPLFASFLMIPIANIFYRCIEVPSHMLARKFGSASITRRDLPVQAPPAATEGMSKG